MMPKLTASDRATLKIREKSSDLIAVLSANEDVDKILGSNIGADDYVTKRLTRRAVARVNSAAALHETGNLPATIRRKCVSSAGFVNDDLKRSQRRGDQSN